MPEITAYTAISSVESDDLLVVVDVHDTSMSPAGTTKKMTLSQLGYEVNGSAVAPVVVALAQSGGAVAVNAAAGNVFTLALTASGWTISNPSSPADGQVIRIRLIQDATGGRTVAWGTAYDFGSNGGAANSPPSLTAVASKADILAFEYVATSVGGSPLDMWCYLGAAIPQGF
jgi:hypothetical protein